MSVRLYSFVDVFSRGLVTAEGLLAKARSFASSNSIPEAEILDWRLTEDMQPFAFQVAVVIDFSTQWPARAAGMAIPSAIGFDLPIDGLLAAAKRARDFLDHLQPDMFDGRDNEPIRYRVMEGLEPSFPASQWLSVFANTNFFFHLSIAYGILRSKGVPLGKGDMFAAGL